MVYFASVDCFRVQFVKMMTDGASVDELLQYAQQLGRFSKRHMPGMIVVTLL